MRKPAEGHSRIKAFMDQVENNPNLTKSQTYKELLLIQQEQKTNELEMKMNMMKKEQELHSAAMDEKPNLSKTFLNALVRILGFTAAMLVVMYLLRKVDLKGGIGGGDMDLFKDNFQEYHPPARDSAGNLVQDNTLKTPEDDEGTTFSILWGKKEKQNAPQVAFDSVTFDDVMGNADAKEELSDLVDYLRHPEKYQDMGIKLPKGVLLAGPPGTGKTLMARALAGEAEVPFINVNGSSFVQMFAGLGAQRVRRLFARAKELSPCIIFIDEIDALGARRDQPQNYSRQSLNQLLGEMDGFADTSGVIVVGATNLAHTLDPALIRPGRFDRSVEIVVPDKRVREQILTHYLKEKAAPDVDISLLAANTTGFSGAELFNLVNRAGIEAVKVNTKTISQAQLIESQETMMMGRASKDLQMTPKTKKIVAYHEAGHALVSLYTEGSNPIYKATILPRGSALGFVAHNRKDEHLLSKESMLAHLDVCMGGRAAEELIFGSEQVTQGASNDFQQATNMARNMVARFGMNERVGKVYMDEKQEKGDKNIGEEVKKLTDASYTRAHSLLKERGAQHRLLADALLARETLSVEQIKKVVSWRVEDVQSPSRRVADIAETATVA